MKILIKQQYYLMYSDKSIDLFDYFNVDHLHGLDKSDCMDHVDTPDDCFIAGMCNLKPNDSGKYFVYINTLKSKYPVEFITLIMHEFMHLAFRLNNYNQYNEEQLIQFAENETKKFIKHYIL